jgi:hypothetical protein
MLNNRALILLSAIMAFPVVAAAEPNKQRYYIQEDTEAHVVYCSDAENGWASCHYAANKTCQAEGSASYKYWEFSNSIVRRLLVVICL